MLHKHRGRKRLPPLRKNILTSTCKVQKHDDLEFLQAASYRDRRASARYQFHSHFAELQPKVSVAIDVGSLLLSVLLPWEVDQNTHRVLHVPHSNLEPQTGKQPIKHVLFSPSTSNK